MEVFVDESPTAADGAMFGQMFEQLQAAPVMAPGGDLSADFLMYSYKVEMCKNPYNHDWATCPYAHPKDRARRRDPSVYTYVSQPCPDKMQGRECPRGDNCPYTHSVAEYWLHPSRFRTQFCKQGQGCCRRLCFFAHSAAELRSPAAGAAPAANSPGSASAGSPDSSSPDGCAPAAPPAALLEPRQLALAAAPPAGEPGLTLAPCSGAGARVQVLQQADAAGDVWQQLLPAGDPGGLLCVLPTQDQQQQIQQQQQQLCPAAPSDPLLALQASAFARQARERRCSFEERSALRLRAYLEQQQCLTLPPDAPAASAATAVAALAAQQGAAQHQQQQQQGQQGGWVQYAQPPPLALPSARRSSAASYASYGGASMFLYDLPDSPTAQAQAQLLSHFAMPQPHSRRASAASYMGGGQPLPDLPEALMLTGDCPAGAGAAAQQQQQMLLPPLSGRAARRASAASYTSCGTALPMSLDLAAAGGRGARRSSVASYTSSGFSGATTVLMSADGAAQLLGGAGPPPRARRGSAASYCSAGPNGAAAARLAPRARRASCISTASGLSFGGAPVITEGVPSPPEADILFATPAGCGAFGGQPGATYTLAPAPQLPLQQQQPPPAQQQQQQQQQQQLFLSAQQLAPGQMLVLEPAPVMAGTAPCTSYQPAGPTYTAAPGGHFVQLGL